MQAVIDKNLSENNQPYFSVIIPTHNRAHLLPSALESVKNQTYKNYELIIINDGSTDNTAEILNQAAPQFSNIKIASHPQARGVAAAENAGLRLATGDFVSFLGDDDKFKPDLLEKLALTIRQSKTPLDLIWTGREEHHHKPDCEPQVINCLWPPHPESISQGDYNFATHFGTGWGVAIRRDLFLKIGGFNESMTTSTDLDLFLKILSTKAAWAVIPEYLVEVHIYKGASISRTTRGQQHAEDVRTLIENNKEFLNSCPALWKHYKRMYMGHLYRGKLKPQARAIGREIMARSFFDFAAWETIVRFEVIRPLKSLLKWS